MSMSSALQRPTKSPSLTTLAIDVGVSSASAGGADGGSSIAPIALASTAASSSSSSLSSSAAATPAAKSFDDDNEMIYCGVDLGQLTPTWQFIVLSGSVFFFYFAYSICQVQRARTAHASVLSIFGALFIHFACSPSVVVFFLLAFSQEFIFKRVEGFHFGLYLTFLQFIQYVVILGRQLYARPTREPRRYARTWFSEFLLVPYAHSLCEFHISVVPQCAAVGLCTHRLPVRHHHGLVQHFDSILEFSDTSS